jgi:uncharacterized OsmC-like protein
MLEMKCVIESAGAVASTTKLDAHEFFFDQPRSVLGGEDRGPSPLDVMVAAIGACAHYFAAAFLFARKIAPDGLRVVAVAEKERDPSPRISKLNLQVAVPASVPAHYLPALERAIKNCPAYNTLLHPPTVGISLSRDVAEPEPAVSTATSV